MMQVQEAGSVLFDEVAQETQLDQDQRGEERDMVYTPHIHTARRSLGATGPSRLAITPPPPHVGVLRRVSHPRVLVCFV